MLTDYGTPAGQGPQNSREIAHAKKRTTEKRKHPSHDHHHPVPFSFSKNGTFLSFFLHHIQQNNVWTKYHKPYANHHVEDKILGGANFDYWIFNFCFLTEKLSLDFDEDDDSSSDNTKSKSSSNYHTTSEEW